MKVKKGAFDTLNHIKMKDNKKKDVIKDKGKTKGQKPVSRAAESGEGPDPDKEEK